MLNDYPNRNRQCSETDPGFLFARRCDSVATIECEKCGKSICDRHSKYVGNKLRCKSCAKKYSKKIKICGFLVTMPVVCILVGGVIEGFGLLFISIVCTAGVGLVFWIPLWWVVGWVTLSIWGAFKERGEEESTTKSSPLNHDQIALTTYLRQARALGMTETEVILCCRTNGWSDAEIEKARRLLSGEGV